MDEPILTIESIREALSLCKQKKLSIDKIVCSPKVIDDLNKTSGFLPISHNGLRILKEKGSIGKLFGMDVVVSNKPSSDVYLIGKDGGMMLGPEGYFFGKMDLPFKPQCGICAVLGKLCKMHRGK